MAKNKKKPVKKDKVYLPLELPDITDYKDFGGVIKDIGKSALNLAAMPLEIATGSNFYDPKMDTELGVNVAKGSNLIGDVGKQVAPSALNMLLPGLGTAVGATQAIGSEFIEDNTNKGNEFGGNSDAIIQGSLGLANNLLPMIQEMGDGGKIKYQGVEMSAADAKALYEARKAYNASHSSYKSKGNSVDSKYALSQLNSPYHKTIFNLSTKYNIPIEVDPNRPSYGNEGDVNKYNAYINYELPTTTSITNPVEKTPLPPIDPNYQYKAKEFQVPEMPTVEPVNVVPRTGYSAKTAQFLGTTDTYQPELLNNQGPIVTGMEKKAMGGPMDMTEYNGNTHEGGGIPLGNTGTEVEGGEVRVQDYIFSDRLGPKGMDKSFAQIAKSIDRKYKRENDAASNRAKERELKALMMANEESRLEKESMESQELLKFGGYLKYENGGMFIDSTKRGAFAKAARDRNMGVQEFAAHIMNHKKAYGGKIKAEGGDIDWSFGVPEYGKTNMSENYFSAIRNAQNPSPKDLGIDWSFGVPQGPGPMTPGINPNTQGMPEEKSYDFFDPNNEFGAKEVGLLTSNLGAGYNLMKGMQKPEETKFERFTPEEISLQAQRDAAAKKTAMARTIASQNIRGNATSSGQALSNLAAANSSLTSGEIDNLLASYAAENNANVGIRNQAGQMNTQIANQEVIANEQNKAMKDSLVGLGLSNMGMNTQGYLRDKGLQKENTQMNQKTLSAINAMFPHYKIGMNPEQDQYIINFVSQQLGNQDNNLPPLR